VASVHGVVEGRRLRRASLWWLTSDHALAAHGLLRPARGAPCTVKEQAMTEPLSSSSSPSSPNPQPVADRLRDDLATARSDLARLRDDLRLQVHLGRKDAADLWQAVEPRLHAAEKRLADAARHLGEGAEEARLQAHLGVAEVKTAWPGLEGALTDLVDDAKAAGADVRTGLDRVRVRAHLAAMEAGALGERAVTSLQKSAAQWDRQTKATIDELRASLAALKGRLPR
jgi:hypothetical protein